MRHELCLPLFLFVTLGCDGHYMLGDLHHGSAGGMPNDPSDGGAGGSSVAGGGSITGQSGAAGSAGASSGGSGNGGGTSGSSAGGSGGAGPTRGRWLASETFVSSSSTQTALSLIDLQNPDAAALVLDSQAGSINSFSGDGRWLMYNSFRSASAVDVYVMNLEGATPGQPQLLLTTGGGMPCKWAPDSSRIACIQDSGLPDAGTRQVMSADTSGAIVSAATAVGVVLPKSAGSAVGAERDLRFLDRDHVVYSYGANDFARVTWQGQQASSPELLGLGGGTIVQQSPDGARVLIKDASSLRLADFRLGQVNDFPEAADAAVSVSNTLEAAVGIRPPPAGSTSTELDRYYILRGIDVTLENEVSVEPGRATFPSMAFVGRTIVRTQGERVLVTTIRDIGVIQNIVAGDYANVNRLELDATGRWLYIGTSEFDAQQQPIAATAQHWLSQLKADGPTPAQLVGQGYLVRFAHFAPDDQSLVLQGYDTKSTTPSAYRLLDLRDATQIKPHTLDIPFNWAETLWSPDSRYLSFIGGEPGAQKRSLYVVDTLEPTAAPRLITQCGSSSENPAPACPALTAFQP